MIGILVYILRNVERWEQAPFPSELDCMHWVVHIFEILLRDTVPNIRLTATKAARVENEKAYGEQSVTEVVGRKIDIIMQHEKLELSASEWKIPGCGDGPAQKQHSKNLRVNACISKELRELPFSQEEREEMLEKISTLCMGWI
ncbi:hypothetical protein DFQ30_002190, partial [Apophysomyces sp. BC1015]